MGQEVDPSALGRERRREHRARLHADLDVLAEMLTEHGSAPRGDGRSDRFDSASPRVGVELELVLVDPVTWQPRRTNRAVLERIAGSPDGDLWGPEISAHTLELNVPPGALEERGLLALEHGLRARLDDADARARRTGPPW